MNSGTRMCSPTAVQKLEELQTQSGYDVDFPNKIPDMAAFEVMSDFLDQTGERSGPGMMQASIQLVGDPRYQAAVKKRIETLTRELEVGDGDKWSKHERLDHRRRLVELVHRVESAIRKCGSAATNGQASARKAWQNCRRVWPRARWPMRRPSAPGH